MPQSIDANASGKQVLESQFGPVEYVPSELITFPEGLFGYEDLHAFLLYDYPLYRPFGWLISIDNSELMFPVAPVDQVLTGYDPNVPGRSEDDLLFVIITIGKEDGVTANLRAPMLISKTGRSGRQVILTDSNYPLRHPMMPQGEGS